MTLDSPAKLNLFLRVLGKRKDGYHELVTVFHRISLRDTLAIKRRPQEGIRIFCSHLAVPLKDNLISRAFYLLKKKYHFSGGVNVRLVKRIPVGGGLGGGSSNAATFLLGMNRLFRLGLTQKKLMHLGGQLGSDVPFFVSGMRHAMGLGRGEKIRPLPFKEKLWFLLFPSAQGLSTAKVYAQFHLPRPVSLTRVIRDAKITPTFSENGNLVRPEKWWINDLTESAERIKPSLGKTRERLGGLHLGVCQMSGSGPTLFMVFRAREKAIQAHLKIRKRFKQIQNILICHSF